MQDATMQELDYLVTADDIAYLNHYHTQMSPAFQRRRTYVGLVMTVCGVFGFLTSLTIGGPALFFMALLIFMGVWTTLAKNSEPSKRHVQHIRRLYEEGKNRALFGHHHVRLLPDRIEVSTEFSRGEVKWEGVERVVDNEQYIFIYVSALNAYVINKKYFPSEQHAQHFFALAQHSHAQALRLEGASLAPNHLLPAMEIPSVPTHLPVPAAPHIPAQRPLMPSGHVAKPDAKGGGTDGSL